MSEDEPARRLADELSHPELAPAFVPVRVDANTVHIRAGPWSGPIVTLRDDDEENEVARLIELLDGETHIEEIVESFAPEQRREVVGVIEALADKGIVRQSEAGSEAPLGPRVPLREQYRRRERRRVDDMDVLVVDGGEMGSMIVPDLLSAGVGTVSYLEHRGGGEALGELGSRERVVHLEDSDALEAGIEAADFVVYAADRPVPELVDRVNRTAHRTGTPWTAGQVYGYDGIVGPSVIPGETACYECFIERALGNVPSPDRYLEYLDHLSEREGLASVSRRPLSRVVAGYLALDAVHLLAYGVGFTTEQAIRIDGLDLSYEANDVLKLPKCDVCGPEAGPDVTRFLGLEDFQRDKELIRNSEGE